MQLQFTNRHIFFALDSIWNELNYKFKYTINQLVTANPDDDFVQTVEISEAILVQIFSTVTVLPEGVSAYTNAGMLAALVPQLEAVSNLAAVQAGQLDANGNPVQPNEAARIQMAIYNVDRANIAMRNEKIARGKAKILA